MLHVDCKSFKTDNLLNLPRPQDLIKYTPEDSQDFASLNEAFQVAQNFVNEYNVQHSDTLFPQLERPQRHLVKNSFIVELSEGQRKLRHLFLFNDVLVSWLVLFKS